MPTPTEVLQPAYLCHQQSDLWPEPETEEFLAAIGHALYAIKTLKELGWTVGHDSELLPPDWARKEFG